MKNIHRYFSCNLCYASSRETEIVLLFFIILIFVVVCVLWFFFFFSFPQELLQTALEIEISHLHLVLLQLAREPFSQLPGVQIGIIRSFGNNRVFSR